MIPSTSIEWLTPPGSGAIACVAVRGNGVWQLLRDHFLARSGNKLIESPSIGYRVLGKLLDLEEELILLVRATEPVAECEIHLHGGREVCRWLNEYLESILKRNQTEASSAERTGDLASLAMQMLPQARTLASARILLDQANGAMQRSLEQIVHHLEAKQIPAAEKALNRLTKLFPAGLHLVKPFSVVLAGAPNVGKSSLLNALVGFQRSIVSPTPGTTRDAVSTANAIGGWEVEFTDTAGLRETTDPLEREGIDRARQRLSTADLCLWLIDSSDHPKGPTQRALGSFGIARGKMLLVLSKIDLSATWDLREIPQALPVSATKGLGLPQLAAAIVDHLVPVKPLAGEGVPFTVALAEKIADARKAIEKRDWEGSLRLLREGFSVPV